MAGGRLLWLVLLSCRVPCLLSLSCFACGALHLNMALFRILRGFLEGFGVCVVCSSRGVFHRVHWSGGVQCLAASGPAIGWLWSSGDAFPAFCPLYCIVLVGLLANTALLVVFSRF